MSNTHTYKIKISEDRKYEGEIELSPSGFIGITMSDELEPMVGQTEHEVKQIFQSVGNIYAAHGSLLEVKIKPIEEEVV